MANPRWRVGISQSGFSLAYWYDPDEKTAANVSQVVVDPRGNVGLRKHEFSIMVDGELTIDEDRFIMVADVNKELRGKLHQLWNAGPSGIVPPSGEDINRFGTPKSGGGKGPRR